MESNMNFAQMTDDQLMRIPPETMTKAECSAVAAELRRRARAQTNEADQLETYGRMRQHGVKGVITGGK
jgi:hypothetical protein